MGYLIFVIPLVLFIFGIRRVGVYNKLIASAPEGQTLGLETTLMLAVTGYIFITSAVVVALLQLLLLPWVTGLFTLLAAFLAPVFVAGPITFLLGLSYYVFASSKLNK